MVGRMSIGTSALGLLAIGMRAMAIAVVMGVVGNGLAMHGSDALRMRCKAVCRVREGVCKAQRRKSRRLNRIL